MNWEELKRFLEWLEKREFYFCEERWNKHLGNCGDFEYIEAGEDKLFILLEKYLNDKS